MDWIFENVFILLIVGIVWLFSLFVAAKTGEMVGRGELQEELDKAFEEETQPFRQEAVDALSTMPQSSDT